jgi:serine/threonine-protein kinase
VSDTEPGSRVGSRLGPYQLIRLLGRGGMGEVYEAEDTREHRILALKLIPERLSGNPVFRARMEREADTVGRLAEPHVVPIHEYGEIDGQFYVDMRLIEGTDLRTMLTRYAPLSLAQTVAIMSQIAAALDAAHASGVVHCDVKPENILITGDDFAYLTDFGIARAATDAGLTESGAAVGTYHYVAPERFTSDEVTYRADIYALACVLHECLTGSPPYQANTSEQLITAHLMQPAPRPSELRPGKVPAAFDQVIAMGMAKKPEERYGSAGELAVAANEALTVPEQQQAAMILQQSEKATLPAGTANAGFPVQTKAAGADREIVVTPTPSPSEAETIVRPASSGAEAQTGSPGWEGSSTPPPATKPEWPPAVAGGRSRRALWMLAGSTALLLVAIISVTGYLLTRLSPQPTPSPRPTPPSGQSVLPFNGINFHLSPGGVALDKDGSVYVTNQGMYGRVVKLAAGSSTPTVLPFTGLYEPQGLAADSNGTVYVTDFNHRVAKLAPGSNNPTELPFTDLNYPEGLAVDTAGNVYVADRGNDRVVELAAGSSIPTVLLSGLNHPDGVAVDTAGNVYVTDSDNDKVLKLAAGSSTSTVLPFTGLTVPWGVAVDTAGTVYVTDHDTNKVVKLAAGSNTPTELPFTGLNTPLGVAVDTAGNVYVADRGNNRVVKLAAG